METIIFTKTIKGYRKRNRGIDMESLLILENRRKIRLEDIKCPICGERMTLHNGESSFVDSELYRRPMSPPFVGYQTRQRNEY
jgi:tRNA U54 and U55 pseudouridine synthase Pus10